VALGLTAFRISSGFRETMALGVNLPSSGRMIGTAEGQFFLLEKGDQTHPMLLFAHGTAAWSGLWEPTLTVMGNNGFQAVGFDMPPFGFSEHAADKNYDRPRQAQRIIALLEALDAHPIIIAHSVGAGPVAEAVMQRPDLVSGMIIVDGAIALDGHADPKPVPYFLHSATFRDAITSSTVTNPLLTKQLLRQFMYIKDAVTPEIVQVLQQPQNRKGYTTAVSQWIPQLFVPPANARSTRRPYWQSLQVPTAFIWGNKDDITPIDQAQELHNLVNGSKLFILSNVGHIPQIEDAAQFWEILLKATTAISNEQ